jgi:hypothetical protein
MKNVIPFPYQNQVVRFNVDGWINATDIARVFDKEPKQWLRQFEALEYISALAEHLGTKGVSETQLNKIKGMKLGSSAAKTATLRAARESGLVKVAAGHNGGTWLHPKLGVRFAQWLDVRFAVWCDMQIDALLRGDLSALQRYEQACQQLDDQIAKGSMAGRELANHRWQKPLLEARADYWREQLQMSLPLLEKHG